MTPSQQLIARLREMGWELPEGTEVRRTHAGAVQRVQGAWSWFLYHPTEILRPDIGSHWPVWVLLRHQITVGGDEEFRATSYSVDPVHEERAAAFEDLRQRKAADDARATSVTLRRIRSRR